jgi:hypothetical protein
MNEDGKIIWDDNGNDPDCLHHLITFNCIAFTLTLREVGTPMKCTICDALILVGRHHPTMKLITEGSFAGELTYMDDEVEDEIKTITKGYTIALKQVLTWIENEIGGAQDKMGTLVNQISKELKTLEQK